jgi:hypothetical protein
VGLEYLLAENEYELLQVPGGVDVDEKCVVPALDLGIVKSVFDQSCFTHTARRDDGYVATIKHCGDQFPALGLTVTKIFRRDVSADNKWIAKSVFHN